MCARSKQSGGCAARDSLGLTCWRGAFGKPPPGEVGVPRPPPRAADRQIDAAALFAEQPVLSLESTKYLTHRATAPVTAEPKASS